SHARFGIHDDRPAALVLDLRAERQLAARIAIDLHRRPRRILAREHALRERVLEVLLDRALQRARAVLRIPANLGEIILRAIGQLESELPPPEALGELFELDVDDPPQLRALKALEDDDLVKPVDELRPERLPHVLGHRAANQLAPIRRL